MFVLGDSPTSAAQAWRQPSVIGDDPVRFGIEGWGPGWSPLGIGRLPDERPLDSGGSVGEHEYCRREGCSVPYADLRYNDVRQKSVHNAFQRSEGIYDQVLYWRVRSLEVDIHSSGHPFAACPDDDWLVFHGWTDPLSNVLTLDEFLQICAGVQHTIPDHEVITLFVDIKDGFPASTSSDRSWARFDALLDRHLGAALYRPADLLGRAGAATLRDAVQGTGWPTLSELRGKFLVVLTGSETQLAHYIVSPDTAEDRSAFLSRGITAPGDIGADDDIVFFNMDNDHVALANVVGELGFVSRAYYVDDDDTWNRALTANCHHIATDMVNARVDRWSTTSGPTGFPFRAMRGATPRVTEPGHVGGIWARSGDIWNRNDSFVFHHTTCRPDDVDNTYVFAISGPNSHVDDWVKGGVVARRSVDSGSAYLGVFRVGEKHGLRVQVRPAANAPTFVLERRIGPSWAFGADFAQDTLVYVRLEITEQGRHAAAAGSVNGSDWVALGSHRFDEPLELQGLAASSHAQRRGAKFLFVVPDGRPPPVFESTAAIGTEDDPAEGWVDWNGTRRWRTDRFGRS